MSSLTGNLKKYISATEISTDCTFFKLRKQQQHYRGREKKIPTFISYMEFPVQSL